MRRQISSRTSSEEANNTNTSMSLNSFKALTTSTIGTKKYINSKTNLATTTIRPDNVAVSEIGNTYKKVNYA